MRLSVLAFPSSSRAGLTVHGTLQVSANGQATTLEDRAANGEASPGESVVRLPRKLGRKIVEHVGCTEWSLVSIDLPRTLQQGRPLFYGEEVKHPADCPCSNCQSILRNPYLSGY